MVINKISYSSDFYRQFRQLPYVIKKKTLKQESIFRSNPFHPSLRLHKLQGKLEGRWSISIDRAYRIIFRPVGNGEVVFLSVGRHAIYS